jgi:hypothetical protein
MSSAALIDPRAVRTTARAQLAADVLDGAQRLDERPLGQVQDTDRERLGGSDRGRDDLLRGAVALASLVPSRCHGDLLVVEAPSGRTEARWHR